VSFNPAFSWKTRRVLAFFIHEGAILLNNLKENKTDLILNQNPLWKGLIRLSIPVFFVNILKTIHDLVDGFFLGQVPDVAGVSVSTQYQNAVGLTWSVFYIFISFGTGLCVAGNGLISQYIGKKDEKGAVKLAANTILLSLMLGILFALFLFLFTPNIMRLMGAQGAELQYAITYLRIRCFELPFLFLSYAFQAVRQSTGDTTTPVVVSVIAIVANIILTPVMILWFQWGIVGAAVSTLCANVLMTPLMLFVLIKPKNGLKIAFHKGAFDLKVMKHLMQIAIPASIGQSMQSLGFVVMTSMIYQYGLQLMAAAGQSLETTANALPAAYYIGNRINSLVFFPVTAISSVLTIYLGQNIGAGNIPRARKVVRTGLWISVGMMTVGMLLIIPLRAYLVRFFNSDPQTLLYASDYMLFLHLGLPLMGVYNTYLAAFQGSGDTKFTLVLATIRLWIIRLPLIFLGLYVFNLGANGVWYAMLFSNIAIVPIGMFLYSKINFLPKIKTAAPESDAALTI